MKSPAKLAPQWATLSAWIVESGPAEELFASENPFVKQFLAGASAGPLGMD